MPRTDQASSDPGWFARPPPGSPGFCLARRVTRYEQTCQQERVPINTSHHRQEVPPGTYLGTGPSTQTATVRIIWKQQDENENAVRIWELEPMRMHCIFRFEMEHALRRVGFSIEAVYGDFFKNELTETSSQMIWVARNGRN